MSGADKEQHALERWGVQSCDHCGSTIVLGEYTRFSQVGGHVKCLCAACASAPRQIQRLRLMPKVAARLRRAA
jgi:hypothetical protein